MTITSVIRHISAAAFFAAALQSCFTGIDSTPRIDAGEVRRNNAGQKSAEQLFIQNLAPLPPAQWAEGGMRLLVDDERFRRILAPGTPVPANLEGRELRPQGWNAATSLTGKGATDFTFQDVNDGTIIVCRVSADSTAIDTVQRLEIPFTIDLDLVERTDSLLSGRTLYVSTPDWFDGNGTDVRGLRHIPVRIDSVRPGTYLYPAAVYFTPANAIKAGVTDGQRRLLYMSVGGIGAAARTFDRLFNFESPRRLYPAIEDEVWELITRSRVRAGMTPAECRLALGAPTDILRVPTRGGMRETWSYPDGVFLVFDDGYLSHFRK